MILPPNGYRVALLVIAVAALAASGIAWIVGMATMRGDASVAVIAFWYAGPLFAGGFIAFVLWLFLSALLWGIHSEGTGLVKGSEPTD
jgi:hypothetical protein